MIAYRIQDKNRGVEYLIDPETQYSWAMSDDESLVRSHRERLRDHRGQPCARADQLPG